MIQTEARRENYSHGSAGVQRFQKLKPMSACVWSAITMFSEDVFRHLDHVGNFLTQRMAFVYEVHGKYASAQSTTDKAVSGM
jgi:hypothetical protein